MALIAIHAVVDIPTDVRVREIGRVPAPMATRALENHVVRGIDVAYAADAVGSAMIHGEEVMGERRSQPSGGGVARRACGREFSRDVVRIGCVLVSLLMAAVAIYGQRRKVIVHMATRAWNRRGVKTS